MALISISDPLDQRLEAFRHLKRTNATRYQQRFIVEGEKLLRRLLASEYQLESALLDEKHVDALAPLIPSEVPTYIIPTAWVESLVGFNFHRGVLGCGIRQTWPDAVELLPQLPGATLMICPDVQNPENLGALFRIGLALGVSGMLLGKACADPLSRRVLRVSMGASLKLPTRVTSDLLDELSILRQQHEVTLWGTALATGATPLAEIQSRPLRLGLLFGSEGHGLTPEYLALCDRLLTLPMSAQVDSLNVAVAAGIFLYQLAQLT